MIGYKREMIVTIRLTMDLMVGKVVAFLNKLRWSVEPVTRHG